MIGDLDADLLCLYRLFEIGEQALKALALLTELRRLDDDLGAQVRAVVEVVVLFHRGVTGGLDRERSTDPLRLKLDGFIDNVFVAAAIAVMLASEMLFDKLVESRRGDRVGHYRAAGILLKRETGRQRHQTVAVDLFAEAVDSAAAIDVGIEDHAEVGFTLQHRLTDTLHRFCVLGIRHMVREHPVGIQIARAGGISAQRLQHLGGVKAARAVAGVDHDVETCERMVIVLCVDLALDQLAQMRGVVLHIVDRGYRAVQGFCGLVVILRVLQDRFDILAVQTAAASKELQSVAVEGMVRGSDLYRRVTAEVNRRHEHRRRRRQTAVIYLDARQGQSAHHDIGDPFARDTAVPADGNRQFSGSFACFLLYPEGETVRDARDDRIRQVDRLPRDALAGDTADIGAAFEYFKSIV